MIETKRLQLCGLGEQHLDGLARLQADPRIAEWFGSLPDPPPTPQQAREDAWREMAKHLGHWALRGHGQWALTLKGSGRLIGRAGLYSPEGWPGVEVGWMVAPDQWGRGYATEAGRAAVDFAFERLGLDEVVSITVPHNAASRAVITKVGLTDTGRRLEIRGRDQVLYRLTREQWAAGA